MATKKKKPVRDAEIKSRRAGHATERNSHRAQVALNQGKTIKWDGKIMKRGKNDPHVAESKRRDPSAVQYEEYALEMARRADEKVRNIDRHNALTKKAARRIQDSTPAAKAKRNKKLRTSVKKAIARKRKR